MKKFKVSVYFVLFMITLLNPVKSALADLAPETYHPKRVKPKESTQLKTIVPPDTTKKQDKANVTDSIKSEQNRDNSNFIELIRPRHIAIGGAVLMIVIFSFVILSKMRNKK